MIIKIIIINNNNDKYPNYFTMSVLWSSNEETPLEAFYKEPCNIILIILEKQYHKIRWFNDQQFMFNMMNSDFLFQVQ